MYEQFYRNQERMAADLEAAINGEYSAIQCYAKLAELAPNEAIRKQILEIRKDEVKHFQHFSQAYTYLTNQQPKPKVTETCPDDFRSGAEFAFHDEQHTVDFYLEAADRATDPAVKKVFRRAAADEQQHAVWFLYFLMKKKF